MKNAIAYLKANKASLAKKGLVVLGTAAAISLVAYGIKGDTYVVNVVEVAEDVVS